MDRATIDRFRKLRKRAEELSNKHKEDLKTLEDSKDKIRDTLEKGIVEIKGGVFSRKIIKEDYINKKTRRCLDGRRNH